MENKNEKKCLSESDLHYLEDVRALILKIVMNMLDQSTSVKVSLAIKARTQIFTIDCADANYGQIIGQKGKNIESLRRLVAAMCARQGIRAIIELPYKSKP